MADQPTDDEDESIIPDEVSRLRAQLPDKCPNCGHDPSGDDDEFVSGGGWVHDTSIEGTARGPAWVEEMKCPTPGCREVVARTEQYDDDSGHFEP